MSYRNDHDAALARADALESELAALRRAHDAKPAPAPQDRAKRGLFAMSILATAFLSIGVASLAKNQSTPPEPDRDLDALVACRAAIPEAHDVLDERIADPRSSSATWVRSLAPATAPCTAMLHSPSLAVAPELRDQIARWAAAEDVLAAATARLISYYEHDPYRSDGYASAPALWRAYNGALVTRDVALSSFDRAIAIGPRS